MNKTIKEELDKTDGIKLRKLRKELGFSMEEISRMLDTSYHTWINWEGFKCRVPGHVLFCLNLMVKEKNRLIAETLVVEKRNKAIEELGELIKQDIKDLLVQ
jgi:DNA-binding transcriptional regulator YiaG